MEGSVVQHGDERTVPLPFPPLSFLSLLQCPSFLIPLITVADDFDDDVIETKTHHNNASYTKNHNTKGLSNGDAGGVGGGGSGMVAKAIFLLLLVSLSVVVALILVELRGKQKGRA